MKQIAGIILAAGGSSRYGQPKQLLPWGDTTVLNATIQTTWLTRLKPVIVVLGAFETQITATIPDTGVRVVSNPDWQTGQSSSLKAGIKALPDNCDGALFLLADQPQLNVHLLDALLSEAENGAVALAPLIDGRRANPVYFSRETFHLLMSISGDQGGRAVMREVNVKYVEWYDEMQFHDIDEPEDYEILHRYYFGEAVRSDKV
ncbi:MAG: nucleotidyltransferase family protein [Anaerolineaceae bacterium]